MTAKYYLDIDMLYHHHACPDAQEEFKRLFGNHMDVTEENIRKILTSPDGYLKYNLEWPADKLYYRLSRSEDARLEALSNQLEDLSPIPQNAARYVELLNEVGDEWAKYKENHADD